jgi:[acyl-carrier-protein] S-malonyltransferase
MGKNLHEHSAAARALYDEANNVLGWDLKKISFEGPNAALTETKVCQPALYVHSLALYEALLEKGDVEATRARFALGLSLGEITALTAAGVFDFLTGLRVVAERGRLMQMACEATHGGMAAIVGEKPAKVVALAKKHDLDIANFNCPGQIVISGEKARITEAIADAQASGIKKAVELNVAGADHRRLMIPARDGFAKYLETVAFNAPKLTFFANALGKAVSDPAEIRDALIRQIVAPVLWENCIVNAHAAGATSFLELGLGGVLAGHLKRINKDWPVTTKTRFAEL